MGLRLSNDHQSEITDGGISPNKGNGNSKP